ncbi:MAG: phytoene/squalene synthase family protein [Verrucomicrobiota bacterium]
MTQAPSDIRIVKRKSQSFYWPLRIFPEAERNAIATIYAFCRQGDDWADDTPNEGGAAALDQAINDLRAGHSCIPCVQNFFDVALNYNIPIDAAIHLYESLQKDSEARCLQSEAELIRFAYGVAGVVGLLMCPVLGATDPRAHAHAIDLGIAMQLSNVARDVAEDAALGRTYLPQEWFDTDLQPDALIDFPDTLAIQMEKAIKRIIALAEIYYQSARAGFRYIPVRQRIPIQLAAAFYREIGCEVARDPRQIWERKVKPSRLRSMLVGTQALFARPLHKQMHDQRLHDPLGGLPCCGEVAASA